MRRRVWQMIWMTGLVLISILPSLYAVNPPADAFNGLGGHITALARDVNGNFWVGAEDKGLFMIDSYRDEGAKRFGVANGLSDDNGYAMACDRLGRLWVGHLRHGVSVYNGKEWRNYDVEEGPLGERVFDIAVSPRTGDVWIASNLGLARYSSDGEWHYYTRAHGLPSDQIQSVAVGGDGTVYAGTQCDGVAVGKPIGDKVKWRHIKGPDRMPLKPHGYGLPSNQINAILCASDGRVYIATPFGLAVKLNGRDRWEYFRGNDLKKKLELRFCPEGSAEEKRRDAARAFWKELDQKGVLKGRMLAEDYCTCLAEGPNGLIWIGHRRRGYELFEPRSGKIVHKGGRNRYVSALLPLGNGSALIGSYGSGVKLAELPGPLLASCRSNRSIRKNNNLARDRIPALPAPASPPGKRQLQKMLGILEKAASGAGVQSAAYLYDDWETQGDWVGSYGRQYALLCSVQSPLDRILRHGGPPEYDVEAAIGPHFRKRDSLRHWLHWRSTENPRTLYNPVIGTRRQAEWDDHAEAYPIEFDGPDIWVTVSVPKGSHRLALYFFNKDGHRGRNRYRDYLIEVKDYNEDLATAHFAPVLAHARVRDFRGGVYKSFLLPGPKKYLVRIGCNYSFNTIVSAVLLDQLAGSKLPRSEKCPPGLGSRCEYGPPRIEDCESGSDLQWIAKNVWREMDKVYGFPGSEKIQRYWRLLLYRALLADGASEKFLAACRRPLRIWSHADRKDFCRTMLNAWLAKIEENPDLKRKEVRDRFGFGDGLRSQCLKHGMDVGRDSTKFEKIELSEDAGKKDSGGRMRLIVMP